MITYILPKRPIGAPLVNVIKSIDGVLSIVALDTRSQGYADYQTWLSLGNIPQDLNEEV